MATETGDLCVMVDIVFQTNFASREAELVGKLAMIYGLDSILQRVQSDATVAIAPVERLKLVFMVLRNGLQTPPNAAVISSVMCEPPHGYFYM